MFGGLIREAIKLFLASMSCDLFAMTITSKMQLIPHSWIGNKNIKVRFGKIFSVSFVNLCNFSWSRLNVRHAILVREKWQPLNHQWTSKFPLSWKSYRLSSLMLFASIFPFVAFCSSSREIIDKFQLFHVFKQNFPFFMSTANYAAWRSPFKPTVRIAFVVSVES